MCLEKSLERIANALEAIAVNGDCRPNVSARNVAPVAQGRHCSEVKSDLEQKVLEATKPVAEEVVETKKEEPKKAKPKTHRNEVKDKLRALGVEFSEKAGTPVLEKLLVKSENRAEMKEEIQKAKTEETKVEEPKAPAKANLDFLEEEEAKEISLEEIKDSIKSYVLGFKNVEDGKAKAIALLAKYGVDKISLLPAEKRPLLMKDISNGAK